MIRLVPLVSLFVACVANGAASLAERTYAAMLRVDVRQDQIVEFEKIMNEHYNRSTAMLRREVRTTPDEVDKRVPRLLRTISKNTMKHMKKLLDATQMEAFEYALDLENRRFMQGYGVHEP